MERPILFNGEMVKAILEGKKTQTRRVIKPQPDEDGICKLLNVNRWEDTSGKNYTCPYGVVGSKLWVREAWAKCFVAQAGQEWFVYKTCDNRTDYGGPWKPSIHMPRKASRITLEITNVRVERLNDISKNDAIAEGCRPNEGLHGDDDFSVHYFSTHWDKEAGRIGSKPIPIARYAALWQSINGTGSWNANPWVWVIEFKRI